MVKFGRHVQFFLEYEHHTDVDHYVIPYNEVCDLIEISSVCTKGSFSDKWRECIHLASTDFMESTRLMWSNIFKILLDSDAEESRGAPIDTALSLYVESVPLRESQDLLVSLKSIHSSAALNSEALRKLVKKYDKKVNNNSKSESSLTAVMLPELYSSVLTTGIATSIATINMLRELISTSMEDQSSDDSEEKKASENKLKRSRSKELLHTFQDEEQVERRAAEIEWLYETVSSIPPTSLVHAVAHRGFHNPTGRSDVRPIENSLAAFEMAWNAGIHHCECDIALTKDEKLVLAHDEDFTRLAIMPTSKSAVQKVSDLTFKELISLPLKNGVRPPLLIDVLESAFSIGDHAKLIIEIKPGNTEACLALAQLFTKFPKLMPHVAAVMSFDLFAMIQLQKKLIGVTENLKKKGISFTKPELLLVTDIESHRKKNEMWLDIMSDLSPIDGWIQSNNGEQILDGVYLRFQKEMLTEKGAEALRNLSKKYTVGVWVLRNEDPDDYKTMKWLADEGNITFYNTDLPKNFY
eukprot:CAMPEP_0197841506 /NCGR_PEP_ID=MMETSP1437-20131217/46221_1 /TAXON_ID=49252 ORGANISM="Eucampia antarctica, Strain CCMP1452" /NCGR_SAMPLE_ID=MMETSP1437 /ASSEMBLY_ACC=CAM_ASM_001096 /LENGTH=523 /DNA_ID=CAMNT_0043451279 /DNA_START=78 /DNA_END=1649 /DNA_ORIENTATION=+